MRIIPDIKISIEEYSYTLPDERIAKYPLNRRDESKLLVYDRGNIHHRAFRELPDLCSENDLLVFNNTRVIQARLQFQKPSGANIEIFCLEPVEPATYELAFSSMETIGWKCLVGNAKKWKEGELTKSFELDGKKILLTAEKLLDLDGEWLVQFSWEPSNLTFSEVLEQTGKTPIPPYLNRESESSDKSNYQTVYSRHKGSVAAPTAGLHFTDEVLQEILKKGIPQLELTLHVGAGTFRPVIHDQVGSHVMHSEHIYFGKEELDQLLKWPHDITAVGTTTTRTLESIYWLGCKLIKNNRINPEFLSLYQWEAYYLKPVTKEDSLNALLDFFSKHGIDRFETTTDLMIIPGYEFRMVNKLITNFHQPKSTLLLLVGAFIGEDWKNVYQYALENDFRFLSYGDSNLYIPAG